MMAIHILPAQDPDNSTSVAHLIASGRASALFAVVAGIGLALANGRQTPPTGAALRAARWGVWAHVPLLAGLGMILGELDSGVAVILVNYALLFLFATLGLGWSARRLVWVAAIWVVAVPVASHFLRMQLPPTSFVQPSFTALADSLALVRELLVTGYYPVIPWLGYLWAGMAVGRLDLSSKRVAMNLAGLGALIGVAGAWLSPIVVGDRLGELPTQFFGVTPTDSLLYLAVVTPHSATPIDLAHTIGSALGVVGLSLLAARFLGWIAAAGAMTLSLYTVHVLALATKAGIDDRPALLLIHAVLALLAGLFWVTLFGRGPLEQLLARTSALVRTAVLNAPRRIRSLR